MLHHHHSPAVRALSMLVWLVTAIGALNWGLEAAGYGIFEMPFVHMHFANAIVPLKYIIGACGVISLLLYFKVIFMHDKNCKC